jgi:hypothetical protein
MNEPLKIASLLKLAWRVINFFILSKYVFSDNYYCLPPAGCEIGLTPGRAYHQSFYVYFSLPNQRFFIETRFLRISFVAKPTIFDRHKGDLPGCCEIDETCDRYPLLF